MDCLKVKSVAVIGAGPSGLAAIKYLLAEKHFSQVDAFEQRACLGGLWNYTPELRNEVTLSIPMTNPRVPPEEPTWEPLRKSLNDPSAEVNEKHDRSNQNGDVKDTRVPTFVSPMYERLETNLPTQLMRFSDLAFSDALPLFPKHWDVTKYIQEYGQNVLSHIKFQTQVIDVQLLNHDRGKEVWRVKRKDLRDGAMITTDYDGVVVANGHFNTPFIPSIPGLQAWDKTHPGSISHSKYFRRPEDFHNKKTVVIGTSASGSDVAAQISDFVRPPLLVSARTVTSKLENDPKVRMTYPPIESVDAATRTVRFQDGHEEKEIDSLVFCTGYLYSFPFLSSLDPPLVTDGSRLENIFQYVFYAPHPTLALLGMPIKIVPFPVAESQAAVVARLFSGRLAVPSHKTMHEWEESTLKEMGDGAKFHTLTSPKDWYYMNSLLDWADQAETKDGVGKSPRKWGAWEGWATKNFIEIRQAFMKQKGKGKIKSLDELDLKLHEFEA